MDLVHTDRLTSAEVTEITDLVDAASEADRAHPFSEHVMLHLRYGGDPGAGSVLVRVDGRLVGYGHLDPTDAVVGSSAEVVVHPDARGQGLGRSLVQTLEEMTPDGRLRLWSHGEHPAAGALAETLGYRLARTLFQLRRSLLSALPAPQLPADVTVRTFVPGEDDVAWLDLNARAFADHPDQGSWTADDLHARLQEPWFDPAGFFLAERDGRLVAFHWTKVHGAEARDGGRQDHHHRSEPDPGEHGQGEHGQGEHDPGEHDHEEHDRDGHRHTDHQHDPIGEVYVVGVDPEAQGQGLGRAMTLVGLRHLRRAGLPTAMLYVDESNTAAVRTYTALGFTNWHTDVCFARSVR